MNSARMIVGTLALALLLTGCTPTASEDAVVTPTASESSPSPSPTPTVAAPLPADVILTLDAVTVMDDAGGTVESAAFADPDSVLALLTDLIGTDPTLEQKGSGPLWSWPGVRFGTNNVGAFLIVQVAEIGGLPVTAGGGIGIGSTRADLAAVGAVDELYDADGDGQSDTFALDPRTVPGTKSLAHDGQEGSEYVLASLTGGTVSLLRVPGDDFRDL